MKFVPKTLVDTADISRGRTGIRLFFRNTLLVAGFFLFLYLFLGFMGEVLARYIPDGWERRLAVALPFGNDAEDERIRPAREILDRLLAQEEDLRDLDYSLFVVDWEIPNAIAVPGGGIGVTPPLLELVASERGLAFVLAHELGHHQHRHIPRRLGRGLVYGLAGAVFFGSDILSPVRSVYDMAETGYSRRQEREADEYALDLVYAVYGEVDGSLEFFEMMMQADDNSRWRQYFHTHPLTEERIRYLRDRAAKLPDPE
jgi:beta-barrel assembly-enhancing protease